MSRRSRQCVSGLLLLSAAACGGAMGGMPEMPGDSPDVAAMPEGMHHADADAAAPATAASLYVLDQTWTDQNGSAVHLTDLAGRPRVVAMAYTSCVYACPRIIAEMKQIEAAVGGSGAAQGPGFVLVSIDPTRDTPERLAAFARQAGLDPRRWTLLTGPDDQVLELSVLLGVKYRATGSGDFAHSNLVTLVDTDGVVHGRVEGLDGDVGPLVETLRRMVDPTRP